MCPGGRPPDSGAKASGCKRGRPPAAGGTHGHHQLLPRLPPLPAEQAGGGAQVGVASCPAVGGAEYSLCYNKYSSRVALVLIRNCSHIKEHGIRREVEVHCR